MTPAPTAPEAEGERVSDVHVVAYRQSDLEAKAMWADLPAHAGTNQGRWSTCGAVAEPEARCAARRVAPGSVGRCLKGAVVSLAFRAQYTRVDVEPREFGLCGSHLVAHRNGRALSVLVTTGRQA